MSAEEDPRPAVDDDEESREQDRFLPIANISRIMKRVLPVNAKVSREAKEAVQECVSEFISFITSEYPLIFSFSFTYLFCIGLDMDTAMFVAFFIFP
mmetsp:Transcript_31786/g.82947  ORF Transcript_31786/g.82947 Transcript_31786/m.82947 type:complete len:97 (-) Transcript_31786:2827-3117(-)